MKKFSLLLFALLIASALIACGKQPTPKTADEIVKDALAAAGNVETVQFKMDMSMDVTSELAETTRVTVPVAVTSLIDETRKRMKTDMSIVLDLQQAGEGIVNVDSQLLIVDNVAYLLVKAPQAPNTWIRQNLPQGYWDRLDEITQQMNLLEASSAELAGSEKTAGIDASILKLTPDVNELWGALTQHPMMKDLLGAEGVDLNEVVKNVDMRSWIAEGTSRLLKSDRNITLVITSSGDDSSTASDRVTVKITSSSVFSGYNQPVSIDLPDGAKDAVEVVFLQ